jgi:hypothetical protein
LGVKSQGRARRKRRREAREFIGTQEPGKSQGVHWELRARVSPGKSQKEDQEDQGEVKEQGGIP